MKELETHVPERIEMHAQTQQEKKQQYIGSFRKIKGLIMWELNIVTGLIQPAKYEDVVAEYNPLKPS